MAGIESGGYKTNGASAPDRLAGAEVDALLFGTRPSPIAEEEGSKVSDRPWRYPPWPRCDGCGFRDGAVTSYWRVIRARRRRVWLCEWCLRAATKEEVVTYA